MSLTVLGQLTKQTNPPVYTHLNKQPIFGLVDLCIAIITYWYILYTEKLQKVIYSLIFMYVNALLDHKQFIIK